MGPWAHLAHLTTGREKVNPDLEPFETVHLCPLMEKKMWELSNSQHWNTLIKWFCICAMFVETVHTLARAEAFQKIDLSDMQFLEHKVDAEWSPHKTLFANLWIGKANRKAIGKPFCAPVFAPQGSKALLSRGKSHAPISVNSLHQ